MSNSLNTLKATESETGEETLAASRCAAGTEASKGRKAAGIVEVAINFQILWAVFTIKTPVKHSTHLSCRNDDDSETVSHTLIF